MRSNLLRIFLLAVILLVSPLAVLAQTERPKGLEDRGPLTRIKFIHYKKGHARPPSSGTSKKQICYSYIASGAKWKTPEDYRINSTGSGNQDSNVFEAVTKGETEWEKYGGQSIFGTAIQDNSATYQENISDSVNVLAFGNYGDPSVIAVTTVWGYFSGPPRTRELVEWDMLFNTASNWQFGNADSDPLKMDLQNIATHELGHSAGMGDLYTLSCDQETMYGYSTEGEINKRDLNSGDIAGISSLYK